MTEQEIRADERREIAKFVGWYGRHMRWDRGEKSITAHDLSIMIARGMRAPSDPEITEVDPTWPIKGETIKQAKERARG